MKLYQIDEELRKVCHNIHGVSCEGRIDFTEMATDEEKVLASAKLAELLPLLQD